MADGTASMPGVYVGLDDLLALEHRGRKVSFLPRQPVRSLLSGRFASRMRGRGLNFEEIRDYRPGDDVRSIDWKVTARLQKPHVRVFNEERDRQALLVVDQRLSMFFGSRLAMKSVTAAEAAAIGAWRVLAAGDRVGAIVFNDSRHHRVAAAAQPPERARAAMAIVAHNQALGVGRGISGAPAMLNRRSTERGGSRCTIRRHYHQRLRRRRRHDQAPGRRHGAPQRRRGAAGPRSAAKRSAGIGQHDRHRRRIANHAGSRP